MLILACSLFRLLNVIGNIALLCGYMLSSNSLPDQPLWRTKLLNPFMVSFAAWTYTPYLDGKAPPEKK